ncbi:putative zinc-binding protein [Bacteroidota bacterium]
MENKTCNCGSDDKIVISCSGAADVGHISDQVARKLGKNNIRKMSCLALFAVSNNEKIEDFKSKNILVIDGCNVDCGKKIMAQKGIEEYEYFRITDFGYTKGQTPASEVNVDALYKKAECL